MSVINKTNNGGNGYEFNSINNAIKNNADDLALLNNRLSSTKVNDIGSDYYKSLLHYNNIYDRSEIDLFNKTYRFGLFNPYGAISTTREFLFFTKPDLNILKRDDETGFVYKKLNDSLASYPFWSDLFKDKKRIIEQLQLSYPKNGIRDNFIHLLQNQVISNLEVPSLSADVIETAQNMYGVGLSYRSSSETKDDNFDFSLEFKDDRWLNVYYFFKTYEEYETLKHHGVIRPWKQYIIDKVIHDQFSIYKFLVDEDMETIIYWCKFYGVMPMSLPRDVFGSSTFDNGISYSVEFKAAFFEDLRPEIIHDFNIISKDYYNSLDYDIDIYNDISDRVDNRPAQAAYIVKEESPISPNKYVYKLKWRGSDKF